MELKKLKEMFCTLYGGTTDDIRIFMSPGRVNLIGEHTDYNGGFVFPAALSMRTAIAYRKTNTGRIRMAATDLDIRVEADINRLQDYRGLKWGNYQLGVAYVMQKQGYQIASCDMLFDDTTPHGGGLSSSAAIEVATALAFATISNEEKGISEPVDMIEMAKLSQQAEHEYIGVQCGIMDQFASAMGKKNHAILLNCATLDYELVPLQMDGYKLVIANTNKKRGLADSKYNERRQECETAVKELQKELPQISCLADVSVEAFEKYSASISDETVRRRAKHVVYEIDRVLQSVAALKAGNMLKFGSLMNDSHDSLRDDYEVTGLELDTLVEEARNVEGTIGARMTGAGFGGCTVNLVREEAVEHFIATVGPAYQKKTGLTAAFYVSEIGDGGHEVKTL